MPNISPPPSFSRCSATVVLFELLNLFHQIIIVMNQAKANIPPKGYAVKREKPHLRKEVEEALTNNCNRVITQMEPKPSITTKKTHTSTRSIFTRKTPTIKETGREESLMAKARPSTLMGHTISACFRTEKLMTPRAF